MYCRHLPCRQKVLGSRMCRSLRKNWMVNVNAFLKRGKRSDAIRFTITPMSGSAYFGSTTQSVSSDHFVGRRTTFTNVGVACPAARDRYDYTEHFGFDRGLQHFLEAFSAQWFLEAGPQEEQIKDPMHMIDEWLRQTPRWVPVPHPIRFRQILVARLYSGRRRPGDIQSFAERHWLHTSGRMKVLSVDIIFSETWGNLMRPQTREVFLHAAMQGILTAVVAGLPCETWSIARRKGLYEMSGPVPVRDVHNLEGFPCLSIREAKQVCTGNDLLGVVASLIAVQYVAGNFLLYTP